MPSTFTVKDPSDGNNETEIPLGVLSTTLPTPAASSLLRVVGAPPAPAEATVTVARTSATNMEMFKNMTNARQHFFQQASKLRP
jgi:hypothetical protein